MTSLSGGQAARANLASLLLSRYDVFLLDEPTNDLDIAGLEILEDFVRSLRAGAVLVSHDRAFLERTVHRVLELDLAQQQVRLYGGGYLAYLEERQIARQHARDAYEKYADTRAGLQQRMRTQIGWADKGVREAKSKATDNDKHILHRQVARSEKLAGKVKATERMLDRLDVVDEPRKEWQLKMEIAAAPRSGTVAATLRDAVVERGGFRLGPVSLQVNWADRIAITGPNGLGQVHPHRRAARPAAADLGSRVAGQRHPGRRGRPGPQPVRRRSPLARRLRGAGPEPASRGHQDAAGQVRAGGRTTCSARPRSLSPGERTRAALALLQARGVNLLVLDEPTNHLDLPAIEQLEDALATYPGTFLLVTHDRRMLESVAGHPPPVRRRRPGHRIGLTPLVPLREHAWTRCDGDLRRLGDARLRHEPHVNNYNNEVTVLLVLLSFLTVINNIQAYLSSKLRLPMWMSDLWVYRHSANRTLRSNHERRPHSRGRPVSRACRQSAAPIGAGCSSNPVSGVRHQSAAAHEAPWRLPCRTC